MPVENLICCVAARESDDTIGRLVFITDGDIAPLTEELVARLRA